MEDRLFQKQTTLSPTHECRKLQTKPKQNRRLTHWLLNWIMRWRKNEVMMKENMGKNRETMKKVMTTGRDTKCQCKKCKHTVYKYGSIFTQSTLSTKTNHEVG